MIVNKLGIEGVYLLEIPVFSDERGSFRESFNLEKFKHLTGYEGTFVQDNHSISKKNVFRGLHFQSPPHDQSKLIRVTSGAALDVFLDVRTDSSTYGKFETILLNSAEDQLLFLPSGIAHGFLSLEDNTHFHYKCSNYYEPTSERTINYRSIIGLELGIENPILNPKDQNGEDFSKFSSPFDKLS